MRCWLIPAGAGSTAPPDSTLSTPPAHPRRGGEHRRTGCPCGGAFGSSPPGRGAPPPPPPADAYRRLIPAGAGSTPTDVGVFPAPPGSSPPGRGAPSEHPVGAQITRLIPAGAGSTTRTSGSPSSCTAHPRRGGEHLLTASVIASHAGSSPPGRGAPASLTALLRLRRLIPAGAGSTRRAAERAVPRRAHPRRGGEH